MKIRKFVLSLIILFAFLNSRGQDVGIGQWRDHLPWGNTIAAADAGDHVYCASNYGIIIYDKEEESIQRLTKINGLSDIGISDIAYSKEYGILVVAYSNTNIDLLVDGIIVNISDIKTKQILGNKTINEITLRDEFAYLSCGFGIVVLDILKEEIRDTYYIGPGGDQIEVLDLTYNDTSFFAATERGIYYASLDHPNLANFEAWERMSSINPQIKYIHIEEFNNYIFTCSIKQSENLADSVYYFDGNKWLHYNIEDSKNVHNLKESNDFLLISLDYSARVVNTTLTMEYNIYTYGGTSPTPNDAVMDEAGEVYIADRNSGLVRTWGMGFNHIIIRPNGPSTINVFNLASEGDAVWLAPGGHSATWSKLFFPGEVQVYENDNWKSFNRFNQSVYDSVSDVVSIAIDPGNPNRAYVSAFRNKVGIIEYNGDEIVNVYDENNSELREWEAANALATISIDFDGNRNLWVTNSGAEDIVSVKWVDNTWQSFNLGSAGSNVDTRKIVADTYGQKWIVLRKKVPDQNNFMLVFDERNTPGNQVRILNSEEGRGNLPGSNVFSIAVDKDGEVWLGTDEGIAVFYSPDQMFSTTPPDAERILVNFDGFVQYLLETETVTAIAIDGANRKWMGTDRSGIFLLSADGTEQIHHFTESNSPLFSNQITAITINPVTGEVFIGTAKGLIAYKGTATEGQESMDEIYAFPNPVPPGFSGSIGIRGLVSNANVKITDITGNLIYETIAEGGQAVWNGMSFDGRRAKSGVYLVFVTDDSGSEKMVTKILFIE